MFDMGSKVTILNENVDKMLFTAKPQLEVSYFSEFISPSQTTTTSSRIPSFILSYNWRQQSAQEGSVIKSILKERKNKAGIIFKIQPS